MIIIRVIFAIADNFLVWAVHLSLTVKHLHRTSRAGALQSHLVIDPLPRGGKPQAWSSSARPRDEGRIPGAASGLCSRLVPAAPSGAGLGKSPLSLQRGEGASSPPWRREEAWLDMAHGLFRSADVLAMFHSSYRRVWFSVRLLLPCPRPVLLTYPK